ncbi:MAG: CocE/NonD family hydrolase [Gammaproteobacteria bacterium]|nr:CocE/NonD family hydrolase [Gammaproteobacteria bacterium]
MRIEENVSVAMRDGVSLSTKLFLPDDEASSPWPVILVRTPYDKDMMLLGFEHLTNNGYVLAVQDCRGTYASEGDFRVLVNEQRDGLDMLAWLRDQHWCDGNIGMASGSYVGATQWLPALENPEGLKTITPQITASIDSGFIYFTRGVVQLDMFLLWSAHIADEENRRQGVTYSSDHPELKSLRETSAELLPAMMSMMGQEPCSPEAEAAALAVAELQQDVEAQSREFLSLPLSVAAKQLSNYAPWVKDWLDNLDDPDATYWRGFDWGLQRETPNMPMLHMAGWHDSFVRGQLDDYAALAAREGGPPQKLIVLPDKHGNQMNPATTPMGEILFPAEYSIDQIMMAKTAPADAGELYTRWMDRWLKGVENGIENEAPITLFVQGDNEWRSEHEWPLARTQWTNFYLGETLSSEVASAPGVDEYDYDPANPVPAKGGSFVNLGIPPGMYEQSEIEARQDVLVYSSDGLTSDTEVTGPICARLWVATSAVDTDFTVKLVDVDEAGNAYNVCDGVTRLRYRGEAPGLVTPGEIQEVNVDLTPTSYVFREGHRLRVQVSSSNFPLFDPNPNTGKSLLTDETNEMVVAHQSVFSGGDHPSHIVLPIIPRD